MIVHVHVLLPLALLAACGGTCPRGGCTDVGWPEPAEGAVDRGGPDAPELSVEVALAALEEALAVGLPDPIDIRAAYAAGVAHSSSTCPAREDPTVVSVDGVFFDDCVTADGTHFDGMGIFEELSGGGDWAFEGVANVTITEPDGRVFAGGGEFALTAETAEDGTRSWASKTGGVYHWDDAPGWLGGAGEAGLFAEGTAGPAGTRVELDGGAGYAGADVAFEDLVSDSATCDGAPRGDVLVRDTTGFWFVVTLTGCEGCGAVSWRGDALGEACPGDALRGAIDALVADQVWP